MRLSMLVALLAALNAVADDLGVLTDRYGQDPLAVTIGNGALTVGIDPNGRICALRWPDPSANDQLSYDKNAAATGVTWGILREDQVYWSATARWFSPQRPSTQLATFEFDFPQLAVSGSAEYQVSPLQDRLEARVKLQGALPGDQIIWYADITPATRTLPELPFADSILDPLNDFACYVDPELEAIVHFRPENPGRDDLHRAEMLLESEHEPQGWRRFGNGVWVAWSAGAAEYRCLESENIDGFSSAQVSQPRMAVVSSRAVGAAIAPLQASNTLNLRISESFKTLQEPAASSAESRPPAEDPAVATLLVHQSRQTGSVVRSASALPPLNRDWPRYGAWAIRAFDLAGLHEQSRALLDFYLRNLSPGGTLPEGALPFAMYGDGTPAALRSLVDTDSAWVVWAATEHARALDADERTQFLDGAWDNLASLTTFIARWAEDTTGIPWHAYDPVLGRDRRDRSQIFTGHLAMSSMMTLAEAERRPIPEIWSRRMAQWDSLLESFSRQPEFAFSEADPMPFWAKNYFPADHPAVAKAVSARTSEAAAYSPAQRSRWRAEIALHTGQNLPETAIPEVLTDAYLSATAYVAAHAADSPD